MKTLAIGFFFLSALSAFATEPCSIEQAPVIGKAQNWEVNVEASQNATVDEVNGDGCGEGQFRVMTYKASDLKVLRIGANEHCKVNLSGAKKDLEHLKESGICR